ncbi:hypothetical protein SAMN05421776_11768 [Nocardia farcinica]|uniref:Uncharacterized protein n=1 Tax=Nocardia farcinica TaxID=37329 RepID=A0A0H5PB95_NOCFR|nr:hypothetical protein [Nocardia farcinica]PFW99076.1 hypothetical protein CJ469_05676 [Nocardia farcinica]PFX06114.1 hypothetical protein CJ468_04974 [Nocardia farcinica]CRY79876.1 Uncharacterised protein [Nocardia farcinica]SIT33674.1 hypothetical protein SAMN05421776_11768 [Nocardia farcinica]
MKSREQLIEKAQEMIKECQRNESNYQEWMQRAAREGEAAENRGDSYEALKAACMEEHCGKEIARIQTEMNFHIDVCTHLVNGGDIDEIEKMYPDPPDMTEVLRDFEW